ncbi:MAG: trehalose-phosphatase [Terriglobia bacterium]
MGRPNHIGPRPLFSDWTQVTERIRRADALVLFLDFDGTLVGFKQNPAEVRLDPSMRRLLADIAENPRVRLVFISGRRREDLRRRVRIVNAAYIGLHGLERGAGVRLSAPSRVLMRRIGRGIREGIQHLDGVWLQDKVASLALNYRGAPAAAAAKGRDVVNRALEADGAELRILRGKKVWEILAPEVKGKGAAAADVVRAAGDGPLAIYVGDDATDETAFATLEGAITIRVGRCKSTLARYCVRDPNEVRVFLSRLSTILSVPGPGKANLSRLPMGERDSSCHARSHQRHESAH